MKIHPSQYSPMHGATTNPLYKEGCLRYISVKHLLTERTDIHPIYKAIGTLAEERYYSTMDPHEFVTREMHLTYDLGGGVTLTGRADFVTPTKVIETKASISPTKRAMWRKGQPDPSQLGQLVTYMLVLDRAEGELNCSYVHFGKDGTTLGFETTSFAVQADASGRLTLNGAEIDLTAFDVMAFYKAAQDALVGAELPPMPMTQKPCQTCTFREVCSSYPQGREEFHRQVKHVIDRGFDAVGAPDPTIKRHDRK